MQTVIDYIEKYAEPACEKLLAVALIVLAIIGSVLLVLALGED